VFCWLLNYWNRIYSCLGKIDDQILEQLCLSLKYMIWYLECIGFSASSFLLVLLGPWYHKSYSMICEMQRILIASISKQYILHGDPESCRGKAPDNWLSKKKNLLILSVIWTFWLVSAKQKAPELIQFSLVICFEYTYQKESYMLWISLFHSSHYLAIAKNPSHSRAKQEKMKRL
jgi:hypothetical protein